ncbi:MAG: PAS domain S-box protein [Syntrophales bacterium]
MSEKLKVLILEDVPTDAELMIEELAEAGMSFVSKRVATKASFANAIADFCPGIILSDYSLPSFDGLAALKIAREKCPDVPFIFVSGALGEEMAIDLLKKGATDYVLKNRLSRLEPAVSRALHEVEERRERERAEHALKESEVRYRTIFENTGTATVIVDEDATIVLANRQFERLAGLSRSEIEGQKKWMEFVLEEDLPKVKLLSRAVGKRSRTPSEGHEFRITGSSGDILNVLANVAVIPSTKKTVMSFLDISQLKKAERERREASLYARSLIEASIDPLITINADGKIMDVNSAAVATTGVPRFDLIGSDFADYFTEPGKAQEVYQEVFSRGVVRDYRLAIRHVSGRVTEVLYNASLYRSESGDIQGVLAVARDITERVEAEKKILASNEMLRSLTTELVMTEERERRRIAVDLHDNIGQTLALTKIKVESVMGQTSIDGLRKPLAEIGDMIDQSIQQTRSLMTDLSPPVLYELGLSDAIQWLCEQIQAQHNLHIFLVNDFKIQKIEEEIKLLLFRATKELLTNIVKHAGAKQAHVMIQNVGNRIQITVADDGIGFDVSGIGQVAKRSGGFGLLSIHERLKYLGGLFEIETKKGAGTRISLVAPRRRKNRKGGIRNDH